MTFKAAWLATTSSRQSSRKLGSRAGPLSANQEPALRLWTNHSADSRPGEIKKLPGNLFQFLYSRQQFRHVFALREQCQSPHYQMILSAICELLCWWKQPHYDALLALWCLTCMNEDDHDNHDAERISFSSLKCFPQIGFNRWVTARTTAG